ncbi:MAG: EamA family transporter RarD, partial [Actinobacteria bacterium]|nr:EamA family transporter RarD [Actinomycetota bacterium]
RHLDDQLNSHRKGVIAALAAYALWGFFPLYFALLKGVNVFEISASRIVWSLILVVIVLTILRQWPAFKATLTTRTAVIACALGGLILSINWTVYAYAVSNQAVIEGALGYYINPLVTVFLAVVLLRERLRSLQWVALAVAGLAVVILTVGYGRIPWIALVLGVTFAFYGLTKKLGNAPPLAGVGIETGAMFIPALIMLGVLAQRQELTTTQQGLGTSALLMGLGILTVIPLLLFGYATPKVPLSLMGLMQYTNPTIQFILGLVVFQEDMSPTRFIGFALVWIALTILAVDGLRPARHVRAVAN